MIHIQEMDLNQSFSRMKPYHSPPPSHHLTRVHTCLNKLNWVYLNPTNGSVAKVPKKTFSVFLNSPSCSDEWQRWPKHFIQRYFHTEKVKAVTRSNCRRQETGSLLSRVSESRLPPKQTQPRRWCDKAELVAWRNPAPVPAGPLRLAQNEVKWAISAGVQGPGLSVTLSGRRVRGMDLECWLTQVWGPQRPQEATLSPPAARWRADNDPWPWPRRSQIPGHPERFPQERPCVCVCDTGRILMQSRDQLAHLLLLALCLLRLWSGSPESRHTRMQLAGRENCSEDERGDDEKRM